MKQEIDNKKEHQQMWQNLPLWFPIIGSHIRRLGISRVLIGAFGIYLTIPVFIIIHSLVIEVILRWIICPLFNFGPLNTKKFIILDRYKVEGLSFIDKLHCLFCGWANGICTLLNYNVDRVSNTPQSHTPVQKMILASVCLAYIPPALFIQSSLFFIYNYLIATPLRLEKVYYGPLIVKCRAGAAYAQNHTLWARRFLIYQKISWMALGLALRQIESAWCPIKHFENMQGVVYPDHHKLFFEPHQIDELRQLFRTHGTILEKDFKQSNLINP